MTHSTLIPGDQRARTVRGRILAVAAATVVATATVGAPGVPPLQHARAVLDGAGALATAVRDVRAIRTSTADLTPGQSPHARDTGGSGAGAAADDAGDRAGFLDGVEALMTGVGRKVHGDVVPMTIGIRESLEARSEAVVDVARAQGLRALWVVVLVMVLGLVVTPALAFGVSRRIVRPNVWPASAAVVAVAAPNRPGPLQSAAAQSGAVSPAAEELSPEPRPAAPPLERRRAATPETAKGVTAHEGGAGAMPAARTATADPAADIERLVKVARSIAEQSSMLALNAAIEASRADGMLPNVPVAGRRG